MGCNFSSIKLVKGGTIQGDDKAAGSVVANGSSYYSFGGVADKWGLALSAEDINAADFGVVFSFVGTGFAINYTTHYLKATDFDFSIPAGATIDGVVAEVKAWFTGSPSILVDHVRITVYYTEEAVGTNMQLNIGDVLKDISEIKINIGGVLKNVTEAKINIGDVLKDIF